MSSKYSSSEIFKFQSDAVQFAEWNANEEEVDFIGHAKKVSLLAIQNELTEKQRDYYILYYVDCITIPKIAEMRGVSKSTVSRALTTATKKLHKVLRYSAPHLINTEPKTRNVQNRKKAT